MGIAAMSAADVELETGVSDKLSALSADVNGGDVYTQRAEGPPWWEESGTTNNIYYSTGNVAIGEAVSAGTKLQISGAESGKSSDTAMPTGALRLETPNSEYMFLDGNEIDSYVKTSPWGPATLFLNHNSKGNIRMVNNGGRVGIGVDADAAATLATKGTQIDSNGGYGAFRINDNSTTTTNYLLMDGNEINGANGLHLNAKFNKPVYIAGDNSKTGSVYNSSNYVYMVRNDGRVAIGNLTSSQTTHKLTVDGGIKAEEILVDTVGADFVFEDGYDLMALDEVERFVERHNHLPDIASAEEMQKNGLEMGAFQIKLLQKVEELTLYAIEQNRRMRTLETALNKAGISLPKGNSR